MTGMAHSLVFDALSAADRESGRLYELLKHVVAKIDAGDNQELDILLVKKLELEDLLHELERQRAFPHAICAVPTASFDDAEEEEEEEEASKLPPLLKRTQEIARRALATSAATKQKPESRQLELDLFIADLLDYNIKDDTASMEAPIFSLATKPDMKIWKWTSADGKRWLEVTPSVKGRATMHDKDLLIYLTSQLMAAMNAALRTGKKMPGRRVRFTLYNYLTATDKDTSGDAYDRFEESLERLEGTRLKTNISNKKFSARDSFGLIERSKILVSEENKRMAAIEVTLSEWLYEAIEKKEVLTINRDYFTLRKPLEKKLYELAKKHVGAQPEWLMKEETLYEKTGSRRKIKEFRRMFKEIIESDSIPDYRFSRTVNDDGVAMVKMYQKDQKKMVAAIARKKTGEAE